MKAARVQVEESELEAYKRSKQPEGGTYNIYHGRYSGLERERRKIISQAKYRCRPKRDSGLTKGASNPNAYFCIHFAKGECFKGAQCSMWHRIPNDDDEVQTTYDCFGRDKHTEYRHDMGGIGGFDNGCHTLVVSNIAKAMQNFEEVVKRHFSQFGTIARIVFHPKKGQAYITYTSRNNADFAKEAMKYQALDNNETIDVRWATEKQANLTQNDVDNEPDSDSDSDSDSDDDRREKPKARKLAKKTQRQPKRKAEPYPDQGTEADLPAEYVKRQEPAASSVSPTPKHARIHDESVEEGEAPTKDSDEEPTPTPPAPSPPPQASRQAPTQAPTHPPRTTPATPQETPIGGILPPSMLATLKTLKGSAKFTKTGASTKNTANPMAGAMVGIASYASDSDDE